MASLVKIKESLKKIKSPNGSSTSSWDGTGVDLAVVPPACPHRAAALLLGGVARQDVVAEVGAVQVIVTLLPLLSGGGGRGHFGRGF